MTHGKNESGSFLPMTVTEGVTVNLLPNEQFEFLMSTKEVANGYGSSNYNIRMTLMRHADELAEGKHYVKGVTICYTQPHQIFWTKRGIVRLGFFIKSERAKLFRDWAEELIIQLDEQRDLFNQPLRQKELAGSRKHNRLTQDRMISILADVCRIDDRDLRLSITNKLMKGGQA
jgi:hypothetical protein